MSLTTGGSGVSLHPLRQLGFQLQYPGAYHSSINGCKVRHKGCHHLYKTYRIKQKLLALQQNNFYMPDCKVEIKCYLRKNKSNIAGRH